MLARLRHRTIRSSNYDNGTVHLSSTRNHVLHIVSVTRAVYVRIVTLCGFILYVRSINRDTTFLLLGSIIDLVKRLNLIRLRKTLFCQHFRNGSSQRSLTVVYVTDRTDVYVRFGTLKMFFSHSFLISY